ncbi:membrane-associated protein [Pontibacter ummariensis]|uniref:Membrane-associated protein n=1 Tax=Pontibacter ummariensis TaxID=1610492 RepID=A0A239C2A0_9BACT|nr:DedA family protein [Pontibacter ummariensis]PRY15483.1 membrane-associated protein [Pontibacter ummariensis]SNS14425.1 membrane-associated protein [Pontibacter ummariensis]
MELLQHLFDFILHVDLHLVELLRQYQTWIYLILFLIIFCETGLVVTPFLPGDSLLFALGALAALPSSGLNVLLLMALLITAAILGDSFNYLTGSKLGGRLYHKDYWFLRQAHLQQAERFYARYGGRTIIYARFMPIVRTFAPFVAGMSKMDYSRFLYFNILGALLWVVFFVMIGYLFGNMPLVKHNFSLLVLGIIGVSMLPPVLNVLKQRLRVRKQA